VAVGAQDQKCAALGVGLEEGVVSVSLGTSGAICKYWNEARLQGDRRVGWSAYIRKGSWVTEGVINTAATCLRWLRDVMFPGCSYDIINQEAEEARRRGSELLFYPYLNGAGCPDYYQDADGCFYGISLMTQRGDFALAVMEGIAFQIRIIMEAMNAYEDVQKVIFFGGGAKSPLWSQIIADVTELEVFVPSTSEAAGAGAAILAGMGAGEFSGEQLPSLTGEQGYKPGEWSEAYRKKYERYREKEYKLWR
jgi:xylulokinase